MENQSSTWYLFNIRHLSWAVFVHHSDVFVNFLTINPTPFSTKLSYFWMREREWDHEVHEGGRLGLIVPSAKAVTNFEVAKVSLCLWLLKEQRFSHCNTRTPLILDALIWWATKDGKWIISRGSNSYKSQFRFKMID